MKQSKFPPDGMTNGFRRSLLTTSGKQRMRPSLKTFGDSSQTVMEIPQDLMPVVRELIAKY